MLMMLIGGRLGLPTNSVHSHDLPADLEPASASAGRERVSSQQPPHRSGRASPAAEFVEHVAPKSVSAETARLLVLLSYESYESYATTALQLSYDSVPRRIFQTHC